MTNKDGFELQDGCKYYYVRCCIALPYKNAIQHLYDGFSDIYDESMQLTEGKMFGYVVAGGFETVRQVMTFIADETEHIAEATKNSERSEIAVENTHSAEMLLRALRKIHDEEED